MANVYYITNDLLKRMNSRLLKQFHCKKIERINSFKKKLIILYKEQFKYFSKTLSMKWLKDILHFDGIMIAAQYFAPKFTENYNDIKPSNCWIILIKKILNIKEICDKHLHQKASIIIINYIIENIIKHLNNDKYWNLSQDNKNRNKIGYGGLQQFVLDIKFFIFAVQKYITKETKDIALHKIISNAIGLYNNTSRKHYNEKFNIKENEWYIIIIKTFLHKHKHLKIST